MSGGKFVTYMNLFIVKNNSNYYVHFPDAKWRERLNTEKDIVLKKMAQFQGCSYSKPMNKF